jgi:hypothetical protein
MVTSEAMRFWWHRRARKGAEKMASRKPFLCRTNLHHRWELAKTSDGNEYVRCARCLKERWSSPGGDGTTAATVVTNYGSNH